MLVIRKSDGRIFAFGAECSVDSVGIHSDNLFTPFNALASGGVAPTVAGFEVVETDETPDGHYDIGQSHEWTGAAISPVAGYVPPAIENEESQP